MTLFDERQAQAVLLVRGAEEADREHRLVSAHLEAAALEAASPVGQGVNRENGGAAADGAVPDDAAAAATESAAALRAQVAARATALAGDLGRRFPAIEAALAWSRLVGWLPLFIILLSVAVGLASNVLGPRRQINLLSFPLFLLLAWNVLMIAAAIAGRLLWPLVRRRSAGAAAGVARAARQGGSTMASWMLRLSLRLAAWPSRLSGTRGRAVGEATAQKRLVGETLARYGILWSRHAARLLTTRVRTALHLGAIAMIAGLLGGMYLRGLAFEYRATWESTLLDAGQVQALLGTLLGPAAALLGVEVPDVTPLRGPGGDGPAAIWLHLFAVTALLVVVVPRTLLAIAGAWRGHRLARRIPIDLDDPYYVRMLAAWRGARTAVRLVPYSFEPGASSVDLLKTALHDFFGARADIRVADALAYGDEASAALVALDGARHAGAGDPDGACLVVLFNLAQSPEYEVHGDLLAQLKTRLAARGDRLLVLIDGSAYRQRVGNAGRLEERRRAWERVVREVELELVDFADGQQDWSRWIDRLRGAVWPAGAPQGAT